MSGSFTYPDEVFPSDASVLTLDGGVDTPTGLPYIAKGVGPNSTPTYEVQYNRRQQRQNTILAAMREGMVVQDGALTVGVYPIRYTLGGVRKCFDGAVNQAIPDDSTRVVYVDASNTLQVQAAFPADLTSFLPLATVTAASGVMTVVDERPAVLFDVSPVGASANTVPITPSVHISGNLTTGAASVEWPAPFDFTLVSAIGQAGTAPVGASLIVDVRINGASIFANQGEMVSISSGQNQDTSATKNASVSAGSVVTFEIEQVGSSTAGADLTIVLNGLAAVTIGS